jgi:hypothetical protein
MLRGEERRGEQGEDRRRSIGAMHIYAALSAS